VYRPAWCACRRPSLRLGRDAGTSAEREAKESGGEASGRHKITSTASVVVFPFAGSVESGIEPLMDVPTEAGIVFTITGLSAAAEIA
jgi:hypothetical protein